MQNGKEAILVASGFVNYSAPGVAAWAFHSVGFSDTAPAFGVGGVTILMAPGNGLGVITTLAQAQKFGVFTQVTLVKSAMGALPAAPATAFVSIAANGLSIEIATVDSADAVDPVLVQVPFFVQVFRINAQ